MKLDHLATLASVLLFAEGAALIVVAAGEFLGVMGGRAAEPVTAVALIVLTLIAAGGLFGFGVGIRRGASVVRSGAVVMHILALILVLSSLTVPPVSWVFVAGLGIPAVAGLVLLLATARAAAAASGDTRPRPGEIPPGDSGR